MKSRLVFYFIIPEDIYQPQDMILSQVLTITNFSMDQSLEKDLESLKQKEDELVWEEVDALEPAVDADDIEEVDDEIVVDENFL